MALGVHTVPLSHEEQRFYFYLESKDISAFKISEVDEKKVGLSRAHLYVIVGRLEKKGWLTGVGKGVYLRLPACTALDGWAYLEDQFEVGLKMYSGYIAFQNALKIYGLSEYQPFTVFVATKDTSETMPLLKHYEVKAVKLGKRFTGFTNMKKYRISTKAKTFFDCFCHPQYAAGYPEILKSLHMAGEIDWKEMEKYLEGFGSSSLCQRIGYTVSLLCRDTEYIIPADFLEYLKGRIKNKTKLNFLLSGGKYIKEWMIVDNIGDKRLLSWWYYG